MKELETKLENEIFELAKLSAPYVNISLVDFVKRDNCNGNNHYQITHITESAAELRHSDFDSCNIQILLSIIEPKTEADFNTCFEAIEEAKRLRVKAQEIIEYKKNNPVYWQALKAKFYCHK